MEAGKKKIVDLGSCVFVLDKICAISKNGDIGIDIFVPGVRNGHLVNFTNTENRDRAYDYIVKQLE